VTSSLQLATTGTRQINWLGNGMRAQAVTTGNEDHGHESSRIKNKSNRTGAANA
jgi:hypothetical protein